jgi:methylmalonyl-CoA mutase cobalamin-binding subunit
VAASKGWQPLYLGPNTPVDEILYSAMEKSAKAVALSICYPADDPRLPAALKKLRRQLSQEVSILAGGASAGSYREILDEIRALCPPDLNSLQNTLDDLRERSPVT